MIDPRIARRRAEVAENRLRKVLVRILGIAVAVGLAAFVLWLLRSPVFQLREVRVVGAARADTATRLVEAGAVPGTPLISIDPEAVEAALELDPWVADAEASRDWPRSLVVDVTEREPVAVIEVADGVVLAAADGVVLDQQPEPAGWPVLSFPHLTRASVAQDETVRAALEFAGELGGRLPDIEVWELDDELYAEVEGLRVRLGGPTEMAAKARVLVELVGRDLPPGSEVVLVAPSRPAVRPPTEEPPEGSTSS